MKRAIGLTLLEVLVALTVFAAVAAIATSGVVNALRVQATNEAATSAQAKLRRITEVFTQELRSAVLGGVSNAPYVSGPDQISFLLLDGGAGYQVLPHDSGNNDSFKVSNNVEIATAGPLASVRASLEGKSVLMVNGNGDAVILPITTVSQIGGSSSNRFRLVHPTCSNTIDYTGSNTLIMAVKTLGLSFDADSGDLYQSTGTGSPVPLAFDLDELKLEYVYQEADGTAHVLPTPLLVNGTPAREAQLAGTPVTLARVQLTVAASELTTGGRELSRSYTGLVEMASNPSFNISKVVPCA